MGEFIVLENRSAIEVSGPQASEFLQGILTNDINETTEKRAIYAGLLTPQGKLLFDFFVVRHGDSYLFDVAKSVVPDLVKRLMFYKLRADVNITELQHAVVCASWDETPKKSGHGLGYADPRLAKMGFRAILLEGADEQYSTSPQKWLAHRIALGIPEIGHDYEYGDCFPHDINMDQLNGISFKKGCYVGQEVVSRMRHRGKARKRIMIVGAEQNLPAAPCKIEANGKSVGQLGSILGPNGLAQIRLDRAAKAIKDGKSFSVEGLHVSLLKPLWADYDEEFEAVAKKRGDS